MPLWGRSCKVNEGQGPRPDGAGVPLSSVSPLSPGFQSSYLDSCRSKGLGTLGGCETNLTEVPVLR